MFFMLAHYDQIRVTDSALSVTSLIFATRVSDYNYAIRSYSSHHTTRTDLSPSNLSTSKNNGCRKESDARTLGSEFERVCARNVRKLCILAYCRLLNGNVDL
jgi:hypothetical protein